MRYTVRYEAKRNARTGKVTEERCYEYSLGGYVCSVWKCHDQIYEPYGWFATYGGSPMLHNRGDFSCCVPEIRIPGTFRTRVEAATSACEHKRVESLAFGRYLSHKDTGDMLIKYFNMTSGWLHRDVNRRVLRYMIGHMGRMKTKQIYVYSGLVVDADNGDRKSLEEYLRPKY